MTRRLAVALAALAVAAPFAALEPVNEALISRIKDEGFNRSAVMDTLGVLSDVHGPRLTGSSNFQRAAEWARDQLARWGLERAALEPTGSAGRGWAVDHFSIEATKPQYLRIAGVPLAWSPPTPAPLVGTPIVVDVATRHDFDRYRGTLRGRIVMNGRPTTEGPGFSPEAARLTDAELARRARQTDPTAPGFEYTTRSYWDDLEKFRRRVAQDEDVWRFFAQEGVAALVTPSPVSEAIRVEGFFDRSWRSPYPAFVIAREQYGRLMRLADRKVPVTLALSLSSRLVDRVEDVNVVADIPGGDPRLAGELVMLGAHLDSWHAGTGATDNAAGCAAVLEAVRILKAIGFVPRRTVRVALWGGEEQDVVGSLAYVTRHFGDPRTMAVTPEHATLSAYFNLDSGSGRIRGIDLQGNVAARPLFDAWLAPFPDATTVTILNTGATDHMAFDAVGLPGFTFIQDPLNYDTRAHHTSLDVSEQVVPDDLKQASVVVASVVAHAAMRDALLPRKSLPKPQADRSPGSRRP